MGKRFGGRKGDGWNVVDVRRDMEGYVGELVRGGRGEVKEERSEGMKVGRFNDGNDSRFRRVRLFIGE